jgi:phage-related tail fiber protein
MSSSPIGSVVAFAGDAIANSQTLQMQGWLFCDGREVARTTYSLLFGVIGTRHGEGDGSTTFNLPDYRGRFLRGTNHGTNRDPSIGLRTPANRGGIAGDNTGSVQPYATARPAITAFTTDTQGNHYHTVPHVPTDNSSYRIKGSSLSKWNKDSVNTSTSGDHTHTVNGGGDLETRPINVYVDYLIRFQ